MKVNLAVAVLASCGLVFALQPGQVNPGFPGSHSVSATFRRHRCSRRHRPSATSSVQSITHSSSVPISSVPSSTIPSSSVPLSSVPSSSVPLSSIPSSSVPSSGVPSSSIPSSSVPSSSIPPSSIPSSSIPSSTIPPSSIPSSSVPSSTIPPSSVPSSSVPSSSVPSSSTSAPPPVITCELGTAFGYQEGDSVTLDTQSGNGCNRWGWYETPTLAELQAGISGILYVGAGGNNISNAIDVGIWTAVASPTGGVTVTYSLDAGYFIDEAHIDLDCLPIDTCAPGQYTFNSGALPNVPVYQNPTPIQYPVCSGGSQAYLIIHGSINFVTTETSCEPPVAT